MDPHDPTFEAGESEDDVATYLTASRPRLGAKPRPLALEVHQVWGNTLLESRQFPVAGAEVVRVGTEAARRWRFLGVDMGWVNPLGAVLPFLAPGWSDVQVERRTEFFVPRSSLPDHADHALFVPAEAGGFEAVVPDGWEVTATVGDATLDRDALVAQGRARPDADGLRVPVTPDLGLRLEGAGLTWYARLTETSPRFTPRLGADPDHGFLAALGFGAFLFGVAQLALWATPVQETRDTELDERLVVLMLDQRPEPARKPVVEAKSEASRGGRAPKPEGTEGPRRRKPELTKGTRIQLDRLASVRESVENAGVLGRMTELDAMFGRSGLSADLQQGVGGLIGSNGSPFGSGGLAGRGDGLGGGGSVEGIGGFGPRGPGGPGGGGGDLGVKHDGGLPTGGDPVILGALDRALIDGVIKQHMSQIRYCYQRELSKHPDLAGKVVMRFVIARDGTVASAAAKSDGLGHPAVAACLSGQFLRMRFPEPQGGGIVVVSYPFLFSPA